MCQDGGAQAEGLRSLGENRNTSLVGSCNVTGDNILTCPVLGQSLVVDGQVYVQQFELRVNTCGSSLSPIFILSNETQVTDAAENLQCNTTVPLGQLELIFNVAVFLDEDNTTVIRASVSL